MAAKKRAAAKSTSTKEKGLDAAPSRNRNMMVLQAALVLAIALAFVLMKGELFFASEAQPDPAIAAATAETGGETADAMRNKLGLGASKPFIDRTTYQKKNSNCTDSNKECRAWSDRGECDANPGYMVLNCMLSCQSCEMANIDYKSRCQKMFQKSMGVNIIEDGGLYPLLHKAAAFKQYGGRMIHEDPPIVQFDNLLTSAEADGLIKLGEMAGYERSSDAGPVDSTGQFNRIVSTSRTSENSWCNKECVKERLAIDVSERLAKITGVPVENHEFLQMLRYQVAQYYVPHHDYIPAHYDMPCGPRILTFFLYLSDVEEGGETAFVDLKDSAGNPLKVTPKKGSAILWPNVFDNAVTNKDIRTQHEAVPVKRGSKFAANAWIHLHAFREPNKYACTG